MEGGNSDADGIGLAPSSPDKVQATVQGKVTGIIYPPPDIRAVVDKTAQFVARNGRSFERKIVGETMSAKFSFLRDNDPYHSYYEHKVNEFIEKQAKEAEEKAAAASSSSSSAAAAAAAAPTAPTAPLEHANTAEPTASSAAAAEQQVSDKVQEMASKGDVVVQKQAVEDVTAKFAKKAKDKPHVAPLKEQFTLKHPNLTALDQEIMYLTAQYTALNGKSFLSGLATREQRNPQFDFLKPTHALFAYFTQLVESYTQVLQLRQEFMEQQQQKQQEKPKQENETLACWETTSRMKVLDRCVQQLEFLRLEQEAKDAEAAADDAEKLALERIDWQDFVIVETITFDDEEEEASAANATAWHDSEAATATGKATAESDDDMDMDMEDEDEDDDDDQPSKVKVVEDYVPLANAAGGSSEASGASGAPTSFVNVDGKAIPSDQANEHMRILLMNPKWREETQRHLEKQKESSYAAGVAIADSLKRFAKKRADIFASSAEEEARLLQATAEASATSVRQADGQTGDDDMDQDDEVDDDEEDYDDTKRQQPTDQVPQLQHPQAPGAPVGFGPPGSFGGPPGVGMGGPPCTLAPSQMAGAPGVGSLQPGVAPPGVGAPGMGMMRMGVPPGVGAPGMPPGIPGVPAVPGFPGIPMPGAPGAPGMMPPLHPGPPGGFEPVAPAGSSDFTDEPASKRQRTDGQLALLTEDEFAALHPGTVRLEIKVPSESDKSSPWKLDGQTLSVEVDVKAPMREVKQKLVELLGGMPVNKQQLKTPSVGFIKDTLSSAHYNFISGTTLEFSVRQRGGRR